MESLLLYLLKSAGLLSIFYILYILLLKNDTSFITNRRFLLGGILASLILPAIYFTKKVFIKAPEILYSETPLNFTTLPESSSQEIDWWLIAGTCYLIISAFFILRFFFRIFQILKIIYTHKNKSRKAANFHILETQDLTGPFSFFNYIFMINGISEEEYATMLCHEKVHAMQYHSIDMLLSNFIAAVLWFNPISWRYIRIVEQNLEFIADHETAKASESVQNYQHLLVKVSTNSNQPVLVNHFYQSFIKKRILMLNNKNTSSRNAWKYQLILPLVAVFMMSFNVKTTTEFIGNPVSKNTEPIIQKESLSVTIAPTSSKADLENIKKIFLKWDVELNFTNIEYAAQRALITAIKVSFKNLNSGEKGVLVKEDYKGISAFEIYAHKNGKTGFRDVSEEEYAHKNAGLQLKEIGKNPLYLVNNKQYSSGDLDGKTIATQSRIDILKPKDAFKRFGSKANDGAIMVTEGKIIADFKEELKRIDNSGTSGSRYFIEINKNELPVFISLSNNGKSKNIKNNKKDADSLSFPSKKNKSELYNTSYLDSLVGKDSIRNVKTKNGNKITWIEKNSASSNKAWKIKDSVHVYKIKSLKSEADKSFSFNKNNKMLIILDGEQMPKDYDINKMAAEDIKQVNIIKGKAAAMTYGKKATHGVIEISTKENPNQPKEDFILIEQASNGSKKRSIHANTEGALVIVNGKIKNPDFDVNTINPDEIESVFVLKGKNAVKRYGEKANQGAIEISLKEKK